MKCKCGNDLMQKESVRRTYVTKSPEKYPSSYCLGHYEGDEFEADGSPDYPLEHHDLVDGSDECTACDEVVG